MAETIPEAVRGLLGLTPDPVSFEAPPAWEGRLKEAAYTSPKGTRIRFDYEDVSREVTKRATAFEFPGVNDAYIQANGFGARRYPLRVFFWGENHDLIATAFEAALLEEGRGRLEHPMYGAVDVVPFGDITRRDDLKTAANQSIIEVTFWTSVAELYPAALGSPRSEVVAALDGFNVAAAQQFEADTELASVVAKANVKSKIRALLNEASSKLSAVAAVNAAVSREFYDAVSLVNLGLDVAIGQPLQLALQISNMVTAPARALAGIRSRLEAYKLFAEAITTSQEEAGGNDATTLGSERLRLENNFHTSALFASAAVAGSIRSVVEHTFSTKPEAIAAAEEVLGQFDALVGWLEARQQGLGIVDTGEAYQALHTAAALVAGYLVEISFTLVPERRIVLDRPRTIIDLAAELYGSVDDRLDLLITSNNLTGSEILELPRGRAIAYYP
jgi:prophage DNA circulation protein